ncbi:MAG TPA: hypothetical protein VG096_20980 [Bryobacteraceae bacterium]|jgi:hypothetical protein|nr:hypothetical protein [Bryobacteraceae bacterium]
MTSILKSSFATGIALAFVLLSDAPSAIAQNLAFQGFEVNTGDWTPITTRVPSGGGILGVPAASGNWYGQITNVYDTYSPGYGGAEFSLFGFATQPPYTGDFSQSISLYVFANWPTAIFNGPGIWIDMSPGQPAGNFGGEHNFRLTPTGSSVEIRVDGQASPIVTITTTGWYKFQMTYRKGANPTDLVSTDMNVFTNGGTLLGTTQVVSNSPGGPLLSQDLAGPNYVWMTVWPDGWPAAGANDVLAIDDVRADLLTPPDAFQVRYAANLGAGQSVIDLTNAGSNGGSDATDYICANVYVFAQDQQLISCCTCQLSPNDLQTLSVQNDLINNTLTPGVPTGVTVALLATDDTGKKACDATNPGTPVSGLRAWGTTLHAAPGGSFTVTETKFSPAALSPTELAKMTSFCGFIQADGSKFGICNSCRPGAQGASKQ